MEGNKLAIKCYRLKEEMFLGSVWGKTHLKWKEKNTLGPVPGQHKNCSKSLEKDEMSSHRRSAIPKQRFWLRRKGTLKYEFRDILGDALKTLAFPWPTVVAYSSLLKVSAIPILEAFLTCPSFLLATAPLKQHTGMLGLERRNKTVMEWPPKLTNTYRQERPCIYENGFWDFSIKELKHTVG